MIKKKAENVRLSKFIIPEKYRIKLTPDLDNFIFSGEEEIVVKILKKTNQITLHAADLEIESAAIITGKQVQSGKITYSKENETATFTFPQTLPIGDAVLILRFTGILNDKMRGFYRSRYKMNGKTHHMAVTQFESTDARRAIPCFDEPAQKAVFEVELKVPSDRTAISNTIETDIIEHENGYKTIKFAPTPKMSSYLLAFIVGHFEFIEKENKDGVRVRVYVTPGKKKQAEFALKIACDVLAFYSDYFNIPYPLPALDLIAIPDFAAGAMENWGAITYRETALLVDAQLTSTQNMQWVALVIAHEIAHQWFGNLVTMEWWTHLWLNEGFASYMEYVAIDKLHPEWKLWSQFVYLEHARALDLDGLKSTHAIEVKVNNPAEISEIFDEVSYSKGAAVIRMLAEYIGERDFRKGLRAYLLKHKYSNATTNDLWVALEKVSKKRVSRIMNAWTTQPGYPKVTTKRAKGKIVISQSRFLSSNASQKSTTYDKNIWPIPINLLTPTSRAPQYFLLDKRSKTLPAKMVKGAFVKLNARETSFIRVNYESNLSALEAPIQANNNSFRPSDRFGIIRDAFAMSEAGFMSTDKALQMALSYKNEDSYIVWAEIASNLLNLSNILRNEKYYESYKAYVRIVFARITKHLGWERRKNETHSHTLLRSLALYIYGKHGDKDTIATAKKLFDRELKRGSNMDPDLRGVVYNLVADNGGEAEYKTFLAKFKKTTFEEEKDRLLRGMCLFRNENLLKNTLNMAFEPTMHGQDAIKAVNFVWSNHFGQEIAWKHLKDNWDSIVVRFGGGHMFARFIKPGENFTTKIHAGEIKSFFEKNSQPGIKRTVDQTVEKIISNAEWLERDNKSIAKFLSQF